MYVVDSSHDRIEKFGPGRRTSSRPGAGAAALSVISRSAPRRTPRSRPAAASPCRATTCTWPTRATTASSASTSRAVNRSRGAPAGAAPDQFSYPRGVAANESEVIVSDDDDHRIEKFSPEGVFEAQAGSAGDGPGRFGFPYGVALDAAGNVYVADDSNDRVVKLSPQLAFAGAWGGLGAKPGQLDFPRALASDPAGDTYVADTANDRIEVFDPSRRLPAHARRPRPRTGRAHRAAWARRRSNRPPARLRHRRPAHRGVRAGQRRLRWRSGRSPAAPRAGFDAPAGIGDRPARLGVRRRRRQRAARASLGRRHVPRRTRRPGGPRRRAARRRGLGRGGPRDGADLRRRHRPQPRARVRTGGYAAGEVGRRRRRRRLRQRTRRVQPPRRRCRRTARATCTSPTPATTASSSSSSQRRRDRRMGLQAAPPPADFRSPDRHRCGRRRATCTCSTAKTTACRCSTPTGARCGSGACAAPAPGEFSQPSAIAVGLQRRRVRRRHQQQPRRALRPRLPRPAPGCLAPGSWPPPLNVAPVLHVSLPRAAGVLARRALALQRELQAGLQDPRHGHAVAARHGPAASLLARRPRPAGRRRRPRTPARRAARAAAPAPRARRAPADEGARDDRRRRPHRAAHDLTRSYTVSR